MKPSVLHLLIFRRIKEKASGNRIVLLREVEEIVKRTFSKIKRIYCFIVIEEMENLNLIRKINKSQIQIIGCDEDKELNKYHQMLWEKSC